MKSLDALQLIIRYDHLPSKSYDNSGTIASPCKIEFHVHAASPLDFCPAMCYTELTFRDGGI